MDAAEGPGTTLRERHQQQRPLDATTNGHAPGAHTINAEDYPSSEEEDEEGGEAVTSTKRGLLDRQRLRLSTPSQLLDWYWSETEWRLLLQLILIRGTIGIITSRTVFAPDEHWQSLEIAHRIVFGYGYETWEWRDSRQQDSVGTKGWGDGPIRSILYPALFTIPYWVLKQLSLDCTILLSLAPSIVQGCLGALTDLYTFKVTRKLLHDQAAYLALLSSFASLYTFHTASRTLSNSAEAALTAVALYYWPLSLPENSDQDLVGEAPLINANEFYKSLVAFALSTCLRPSNVLLSIPLLIHLLILVTKNIKTAGTALESAFALLVIGRSILGIGAAATFILTLVDSLYYGQLTFTPLAFLKRNVLQGISIFYGRSPMHFYFTSALPFICFTTLPYSLYGFWIALASPASLDVHRRTRRRYGDRGERDTVGLKILAQATLLFVTAMSLLSHKEVRFLQLIVPILHVFEGYALTHLPSLQALYQKITKRRQASGEDLYQCQELETRRLARKDRNKEEQTMESLAAHSSARNRRALLPDVPRLFSLDIFRSILLHFNVAKQRHGRIMVGLLAAHIFPTVYMCFHSAGQIAVAEEVGRLARTNALQEVAFLMPCHSTPWMSHIHSEKVSRTSSFITCEPPLAASQEMQTYQDESDIFYHDPTSFLMDRYNSRAGANQSWPSHVVLFEALLDVQGGRLARLLAEKGYKEQRRYWNSLFHLDSRRRGSVILMERHP